MTPRNHKAVASELPSGLPMERLRAAWHDGGPMLLAKRGRQAVLRKLHEGLFERFLWKDELHQTRGAQSLSNLTITSPNRAAGVFYDPTPRLVIRWILESIEADPRTWNFVDIGTGRGRVVMEAARFPFRRVLGVEFADELHQTAEDNLAALPLGNIQAGRVGVVHDDATMFSIPSGPTIFFLYNPFSGVVLRRFIDHVLEDHARAPRPMVFFYLNPEETAVFDAEPTLIRSPVPESLVVRLSALSPYKLAIYETAPHDPDQRPA